MKQHVAVYLRLSIEDVDKKSNKVKDESNSIVSQRLLINHHLDQIPDLCDLPRTEFCDDGYSGTSFDRPNFTRMIELAKRGEISCVVVKDLSRFGRDYLEVGDYLEHIFPFLGIRFKAVNDNYDSAKHLGRTIGMDIALKNIVYDQYSKDLSKKVKSAMGLMQRDCRFVTCVPYGYRVDPEIKHKMIIDNETAPVVRWIFTSIIDGKSTTEIAKKLNEERVLTPAEHKKIRRNNQAKKPEWTHRTILTIIKNIKYTGMMVNHTRESRYLRDKNQRRVPKEEWYCKEDAHEAIVTKEEFALAQDAIGARTKSFRVIHDQSDRVYFCGYCGGKLEKENGTVFACPSHRYHQECLCKQVRVRKDDIETVIFEALKKQIRITQIEVSAIKKKAKVKKEDTQKQLSTLRIQKEACEREKFILYANYREGVLTIDEYLAARDENEILKISLEDKIKQFEKQENQNKRVCKMADEKLLIANQMSGYTDEKLREHLYDAIEKIKIYSADSIEIVWKFSDIKIDSEERDAEVGA